jgi:hypothetical protein
VDNVDGRIRFERMREQKVLIDLQHLPLKIFAARLSPQGPLGFTLPNLNGSTPSHSLVLSIQGVESDRR